MTLPSIAASASSRGAGPSLAKLVSGLPEERRLRQPADALVIIGRQLELVIQENELAADVAIGTLRFSLFRLHQGRIAQLAPYCRSITVYGEADVEAPSIPGVEFVSLQPGTPLCQEWFLVIDSPAFWGALITQVVPDRTQGTVRRYLFDGVLTADERIVSRANLLLSLTQRRPAPQIETRDIFTNRACWARVAYNLLTHGEAARLNLASSLNELPEMLAILTNRNQPLDQLFAQSLAALQDHCGIVGGHVYRCEGQQLHPVAWSEPSPPPVLSSHNGIIGQALSQIEPVMVSLSPADPEQALLPGAQSAVVVPLIVHSKPWGILATGLAEAEPADSPAVADIIGVAALLEQILADKIPSTARTAIPINSVAQAADFQPAQPSFRNDTPAVGGAQTPPTNPAFSASPTPAFNGRAGESAPKPASQPLGNTSETTIQTQPVAPTPAISSNAFGLPSWMRGSAGPMPSGSLAATPPPTNLTPTTPLQTDRSWAGLQKRMMGALIAFDQRTAEQIWAEACSMYPTETICTELLMPVQIAVGEGWHRGEVSVAAEHFCSRFVEGKLLNLLNAYVDNPGGPLAIIGCAQAEMHELGAIMLSLFMRWSGFRVIYLGQNVPNSTIEETVRQLRPQVLGLSATTVEAAHNLTEAGQIISRIEPPRPMFIFGGMAFYERPDLRSRIRGQFLEGDVRQIVKQLADQLRRA